MSQVTVTTTTTTPPVTVLCSEHHSGIWIMMAATSVYQIISGQHDVVWLHSWFWGAQWGVMLAAPLCHSNNNFQFQMPLQTHSNHAMGPPQVSASFESWASHWFLYHVFVSLMVSAFRFPYGCHFYQWGLNHEGCNTTMTLWYIALANIYDSWWWSVAYAGSSLSGCYSYCFE